MHEEILPKIATRRKEDKMGKNLHFEKLTLNDNVDIRVYEEAIDFAFSSPDISNIAISGAYGAGKSSVLASYKKKHVDKKFMHISLAHFEDEFCEESKNNTKVGYEVNASVLEGKILNQLIHQIPPKSIPQTNFKIKHDPEKKQIIKNTVLFLIAVICAAFIVLHNSWGSFVSEFSGIIRKVLSVSLSPYARLLAGGLLLVIMYKSIYQLIELQKNKKLFKRVNVKGTEIEVFENNEESYFDKYLNEVLYLFENSGVDAIVFEDMDRFEINRIFERLREINTLVNAQLEKKKDKKTLRFIYLLRDDVFISKDRTKFFDYIIPIVPVLDGTNSYDQLIVHLQRNGVYSMLNEKFLKGVSLYVDDMRLLKNICNEFLIYYNRLNTTELDCNKMFAIITYKNLFPRDFSELQLGKGFIFALFSQKETFIKNEIARINHLIKEKKEEIEFYNRENLCSLEELETIRNDKEQAINKVAYGNPRTQKKVEYNAWFENEFPKRKKAIENKNENRMSVLQKELDDLEYALHKIQSAQLKEIVSRENIDEIFKISTINEVDKKYEYIEIKGSEYFALLKYLVRNGYIDETYTDYMTYFYENSISREDKNFLRSVADKNSKESTYLLKEPSLVVSMLDISDFEEKETLNFYLLKYLLEEMPDSQQLALLIRQLSNAHNVDFIRRFLSYFNKWDHLVGKINILWPEIFKEILESNSFISMMVHKYSIDTLYSSDAEDLSNINIDNCLSDYIVNSPAYLDIIEPKTEPLIEAFKYLRIRFKNFDYGVSNKELFKAVYENCLYELNFDNIKLMLSMEEGFTSKEEIQHMNYTLVVRRKESPIFKHINDNIEEYMAVMLESCGKKINDEQEVDLEIINNEKISDEKKREYILYLNTQVEDLTQINDAGIWDYCLDCNVVKYLESNIVSYYSSKKRFGNSMAKYFNEFPRAINMEKVQFEDTKFKSNLFEEGLKCFDIENDKYKQFLVSMNLVYEDNFNVEGIPYEKMIVLIECGVIKMTEKSIENIREKYSEACHHFIKKNFKEYVEIMNEDVFSMDEMLQILDWNVPDEEKISLLTFASESISILKVSCSPAVKLYILENNLDETDLVCLRKNYHTQCDEIKLFTLTDAIKNIKQIISNPAQVSYALIEEIFLSEQLEQYVKLSLLIASIKLMSREQCCDAFKSIGRDDFASIFEPRKKPKFLVCEKNGEILTQIKGMGWIYEYYVDPSDEDYYRIRRKKPQEKLKVELL